MLPELIGQGIGNTISGLFGGLPGAGAAMRTVVNVKAGVVLMVTVLLMTVFIDLIMAFSGMIMASMIFMKRMSDLQAESAMAINIPTDETPLNEQEKSILTEAQGRILLYYMWKDHIELWRSQRHGTSSGTL